MIFQFGTFRVDIDMERTREFYKEQKLISENCDCAGCRNYEKAAEKAPDGVTGFFNMIGADMRKAAEVYVNAANPDGTIFYGGFYHVCGKILNGSLSETYALQKDFQISFQTECDLVEPGFPNPVLQVNIVANVPWVLEEENTYPKSDQFYL